MDKAHAITLSLFCYGNASARNGQDAASRQRLNPLAALLAGIGGTPEGQHHPGQRQQSGDGEYVGDDGVDEPQPL